MTSESIPAAGSEAPAWRSADALKHARYVLERMWRQRGRHKGLAAALWMNILIAAVVLVATFTTGAFVPGSLQPGPATPTRAVTLFAIWTLSFVPGWLYVRFLGLRADAVWTDYVLALYRLGVDEPRNLPKAPHDSVYADPKRGIEDERNIYRQKFDAYYGPNVSRRSRSHQHADRLDQSGPRDPKSAGTTNSDIDSGDKLFPVFLLTVTLAVGWSVILWKPQTLVGPGQPWAALEFGFLGAYAFAISMLVRRFFQSDLRPSAYAAVVLRIVLVLIILAAMHQLFALGGRNGTDANSSENIAAFVIGFFPLIGLQALRRVAARVLHVVIPSLVPQYPLGQLDGLNIWYETRLVEEGVEDMQNLTTVYLVDVILHTRAPIGRLIDWLDQAYLYIHLPPVIKDAKKSKAGETREVPPRDALRSLGVRSATDLVKLVEPTTCVRAGDECAVLSGLLRRHGLDPDAVVALARLLANESGLDPVWNWKAGGIPHLTADGAQLLATRRHRVIEANTAPFAAHRPA